MDKLLVAQGEVLSSEELFPVTDKLIYNYDFGATGKEITRHKITETC